MQAVIAIIEADDETLDEFKNFVTTFSPKEDVGKIFLLKDTRIPFHL